MAAFKTCLFAHQKKKDGTFNIKLRVTHHGQKRFLATNLYAIPSDLTKGLKIKNAKLQMECQQLETNCIRACNTMGYEIERMDVDELVARLKTVLSGEDRFRLDFMDYMEKAAMRMQPGTASGYRTALAALKRYVGRDTLDIGDMTKGFMQGFLDFIEKEPSQRGNNRKNTKDYMPQSKGSRATSFYIGRIKTIFNRAKSEFNDEEIGLVQIKGDPFRGIVVNQHVATRKRALTREIIQKIIDLPPMKFHGWQVARDCFLLSFAMMGMNSVDMLECGPHEKGEILYRRKKTTSRRADMAEMHVRIEPCIEKLLERYSDKTGRRLFHFYLEYANRGNFTRMLNRGLKKVGEAVGVDDLTFYAARHSLATIARTPKNDGGAGIDKYVVHEMLNHVDKEMKVTDIYLVKNWRILFDANKKVLQLFDWSAVQ